MTILAVFKSRIPSMQYIFKNGLPAVFINGKFTTSNRDQVAELAAEVGEIGDGKSRHPYIYVDENEQEIDTEALSPLEIIKLKAKEEARAELLAEQEVERQRALDAKANISTSSTDAANFAASLGNSNTIAEAGKADSTGDAGAAVVGTAPVASTTVSAIPAAPVKISIPTKS